MSSHDIGQRCVRVALDMVGYGSDSPNIYQTLTNNRLEVERSFFYFSSKKSPVTTGSGENPTSSGMIKGFRYTYRNCFRRYYGFTSYYIA